MSYLPEYLSQGDTMYWAFDEKTSRWIPCNNNPEHYLAEDYTVIETYIVKKHEPKDLPPMKVPKYRPVYKPLDKSFKRKNHSNMVIQTNFNT